MFLIFGQKKRIESSYFVFMQPTKKNIEIHKKKYGTPKAIAGHTSTSLSNHTSTSLSNQARNYRNIADEPFKNKSDLLWSCESLWNSLQTWRENVRRNEEFVFGDQYLDFIPIYEKQDGYLRAKGKMTERKALAAQGLANPPQYNIIRGVARSIVGSWLNNKTLPICIAQKDDGREESEILTSTLHAVLRKEEYHKFGSAQLLQLIIAAIAAADVVYATRQAGQDVYIDPINLFNIFFDNNMIDNRFKECSMCGYYIDKSIDDVVSMFSQKSKARAAKIRALYQSSYQNEIRKNWAETFTDRRFEKNFYQPDTENWGMCRIYKIWNKEGREGFEIHDRLKGTFYFDIQSTEAELKAENARRIADFRANGIPEEDIAQFIETKEYLLDYQWNVQNITKLYYLTPNGDVLYEDDNPYWHDKPSIIFEIYEFFVGKIYPFITDIIDAQKQINQIASIVQLLVKYSQKNLLFISEKQMGDNTPEDLENKLTSYNAVITYKHEDGNKPPVSVNTIQQAFTPLNSVGMFLQLAEKVSSVFGALQGQTPTAGTPAMRYMQESQNSVTSLNGIFEAINSFNRRICKMVVQLQQQYYENNRYIFNQDTGKTMKFDRDKVKNIDTEISIAENTNTPAYRLMINETLMSLIQLPFEQMEMALNVGEFPFKEKMQNYIQKMKQEAQNAAEQGQQFTPAAMPPELAEQLGQYQFAPELQQELANLPPEVRQYAMNRV